jgi:hypothetical protein
MTCLTLNEFVRQRILRFARFQDAVLLKITSETGTLEEFCHSVNEEDMRFVLVNKKKFNFTCSFYSAYFLRLCATSTVLADLRCPGS